MQTRLSAGQSGSQVSSQVKPVRTVELVLLEIEDRVVIEDRRNVRIDSLHTVVA
jgi:hypothetical protein